MATSRRISWVVLAGFLGLVGYANPHEADFQEAKVKSGKKVFQIKVDRDEGDVHVYVVEPKSTEETQHVSLKLLRDSGAPLEVELLPATMRPVGTPPGPVFQGKAEPTQQSWVGFELRFRSKKAGPQKSLQGRFAH